MDKKQEELYNQLKILGNKFVGLSAYIQTDLDIITNRDGLERAMLDFDKEFKDTAKKITEVKKRISKLFEDSTNVNDTIKDGK